MSTGLLSHDGDFVVSGTFVPGNIALPANSVGDAQLNTASPIEVTKAKHRHNLLYEQKHGTVTVTERRPIFRAYTAGALEAIRAGHVVALIGDSTVSVDLLKNGSTILSAPISLTNAAAAFAAVVGAFSSAPFAAGDVFEVSVTATAGTGTLGQGLFVSLVLKENPA